MSMWYVNVICIHCQICTYCTLTGWTASKAWDPSLDTLKFEHLLKFGKEPAGASEPSAGMPWSRLLELETLIFQMKSPQPRDDLVVHEGSTPRDDLSAHTNETLEAETHPAPFSPKKFEHLFL